MYLVRSTDSDSLNWFGVKLAGVDRPRVPTLILAQAHRRDVKDEGVNQGVGLVQIGGRHLLYVGSIGGRLRLCLAFVWLTPKP